MLFQGLFKILFKVVLFRSPASHFLEHSCSSNLLNKSYCLVLQYLPCAEVIYLRYFKRQRLWPAEVIKHGFVFHYNHSCQIMQALRLKKYGYLATQHSYLVLLLVWCAFPPFRGLFIIYNMYIRRIYHNLFFYLHICNIFRLRWQRKDAISGYLLVLQLQ